MEALINSLNQNPKRLSIPDLILVDVFTVIYFVLVTIANSAWLLRDRMIVYTYFNFGCEEYRTETERKFLLPWRVPAFCDFPYLAVTVLLPVQHYLGREVRRLPAKHSNERAVLIHAAGVRHR